jgi:hypothetical protein
MEACGAVVEVGLGNVRAQCPACRSTRFLTAHPGDEVSELTELVCAVCDTPTTRAALLVQIGDEALREARSWLQKPHLTAVI